MGLQRVSRAWLGSTGSCGPSGACAPSARCAPSKPCAESGQCVPCRACGRARRPGGAHFRDEVLSRGGSRSAAENFAAFRGRAPSVDALLRHNGMAG
ncbi:M3 family metallopeptidase [Stenotrophomonas nematodicola]|uniref:M3 family metallopeptidase n=1 Tax=Stenotrophomonas nematodicola TaxID=2656746 RepID=A0ABW7D2C7_9GAMM